jgi:hypothetical protein
LHLECPPPSVKIKNFTALRRHFQAFRHSLEMYRPSTVRSQDFGAPVYIGPQSLRPATDAKRLTW